MIPKRYIEEWKQNVLWADNYQVEQDLIISRAIVAIFSDSYLREHLAFRGGTALYKLFITPAARYSEDIDLVQIKAEPVGHVLSRLREVLSFIEGPKPNVDRNINMSTMYFYFFAENEMPLKLKLKVEINCREHLSVFDFFDYEFSVNNAWFSGKAPVRTYLPEELLATKLRALYQRKKGRDLFDLWYALTKLNLTPSLIISAFNKYMDNSKQTISRNNFLLNMEEKMNERDFRNDINGLLHPTVNYNIEAAYKIVKEKLLMKI